MQSLKKEDLPIKLDVNNLEYSLVIGYYLKLGKFYLNIEVFVGYAKLLPPVFQRIEAQKIAFLSSLTEESHKFLK